MPIPSGSQSPSPMITADAPAASVRFTPNQRRGFLAAWGGVVLDGVDSFIYALVLVPALRALLPASGIEPTVGNLSFYGSLLFSVFLVGWGMAFLWGPLADRFGRKPVVMFYFAASLLMTPVLFLWTTDLNLLLVAAAVNAFFTLGQYSWMPVWLPELFPTRSRATGIAFSFNAPRFIAFLGPLFAGALIVQFGGFSRAAMIIATIYVLGFCVAPFLPETKDRPLPA